MSPRDERPEKLESAIADWKTEYPNALLMFDPQFYIATLNAPRDGHLSEFSYYKDHNGLGRTHFSGTRIRKYVGQCLDYQYQAFNQSVTYLVSPTILFDGFRDSWSQVALNMAVESADYHSQLSSAQPLMISLVVSETAFQSVDAMEEILDALTEIDAHGFYIIIRRNANSPQNAMESALFGRLMYFCHVLAVINEYQVIVGYSDWQSFLLHAAGVTHTATGWYQNLRQFSLSRFQPSPGGRRPRKRYSSAPLLSCPLITPELQDIYLANLLPRVLSGSTYDTALNGAPSSGESNWTDEISCLAHWFSLDAISQQVTSEATPTARIRLAEHLTQKARALYAQLDNQGVSFDPLTGPGHILEWADSIQEFRSMAGIRS